MGPTRTVQVEDRSPLTVAPRRPPATFRPSSHEAPSPEPARDYEAELQAAQEGLRRARPAHDRTLADCRRRMRAAKELERSTCGD
jgi:hypothetical protein